MFDLLKPEPVQKLLKAHQLRRQDNHKVLFSLVMLEQWLRGNRSGSQPRSNATVSASLLPRPV
jgi:hypothetical protein